MAKQLYLWCRDVIECQKSVNDAENAMKKSKTKFLERKHAYEAARKELSEAICSELDNAQTQASE